MNGEMIRQMTGSELLRVEDAATVIAAAWQASPGQATGDLERAAGWAPGAVTRYAALLAVLRGQAGGCCADGEVRLGCLGDVQHAGAMAGSL